MMSERSRQIYLHCEECGSCCLLVGVALTSSDEPPECPSCHHPMVMSETPPGRLAS